MQVAQVPILTRSLFTVAMSLSPPVQASWDSCCPHQAWCTHTLCEEPLMHDSKSLQMLPANFFPVLGELEDHITTVMLISQW